MVFTIKAKPKIVILIEWYLPGTKAGGPTRSIYSLLEIIKSEYDVSVITTNRDLGSVIPYKDIKPNQWIIQNSVNYYYLSKEKTNQTNLLPLINSIEPDLIYINSFWSYYFSILIVRAKKKKLISAPLLLAPRGMLGSGALGLKSFKKNIFLFLSKLFNTYSSVTFHASNLNEAADIFSYFKKNKILIAENLNSGIARSVFKQKNPNELTLFFLSRVAKVKNLHFALDCLKQVKSRAKISFDIFGNIEDSDYWKLCQTIIAILPDNIRVNFRGEIPFNLVQDNLEPYHALFLPTLNENYGHSIVESLLSGCPVIISDQTPWNDLEKFDAGYAISLNHKQKFIEAICELAELDQKDFNRKSKSANEYIRNKIDLNKIVRQYKSMFNDTLKD